jgi:sterol carrier protein 2
MAVGFEKMAAGSLSAAWNDRTNPIDQIVHVMSELRGVENVPLTPQIFANAGIEYMEKFGGNPDAFDLIAEKSHNHSTLNPYAQFRMPATLEQVKKARKIVGPLTLLHCSPTSDGAGCAILASEEFVRKHGLMNQAVEIVAQALATDSTSAFDPKGQEKSCIQVAGFGMSQKAAQQVYEKARITAKDIDVVELHDCFSANELVTYDALGLCPPGKAADFISSGKCTVIFNNPYKKLPQFYKGNFPANQKKTIVNPSGGLISKGHPLGATGLAQCAELCWQLRGLAGKRQVANARYGLQHNIGLGGAAVVTLYKKATDVNPSQNEVTISRFGYNPAVEARGISLEQLQQVMSKSGSLVGTREKIKEEYAQKFIAAKL